MGRGHGQVLLDAKEAQEQARDAGAPAVGVAEREGLRARYDRVVVDAIAANPTPLRWSGRSTLERRLRAARDAVLMATVRTGDRVQINHSARPLYLHSELATVIGVAPTPSWCALIGPSVASSTARSAAPKRRSAPRAGAGT